MELMRDRLLCLALLTVTCACAEGPPRFRLRGRIQPGTRALIRVNGSTTPFSATALADPGGRFSVKNLPPGTYSIYAYFRRKEVLRTIDIGPGTADQKRRVSITIRAEEALPVPPRQIHTVSAGDLAVPEKARKLWEEADKRLRKSDVDGAIAKLRESVTLAPKFWAAWNYLGTIYFQTRQYSNAENAFRQSLAVDKNAFEPMVNLGGALITLNRPQEALDYNVRSVASRPSDALANSQLGMNYYMLGQLELAKKHLLEAQRLDPAHFSHPQLLLAQIYVRMGNRESAADELESFLLWHPDSPRRDNVKAAIEKLRQ
jgi:Flp pilus assembly protein TadD